MEQNKQKEDFIRRLAQREPEEEKPTKNKILGFAIDLNGDKMEYKYKKTTIRG